MVQVHAVGDEAEGDERLEAEQRPQRSGPPGGGDERHRQQAERGQPARVQPLVALHGADHDHDQAGERQRAAHHRPPRRRRCRIRPAPAGDRQRQQAARQQLGHPGEGGVVHEIGVGGTEADGHGGGGDEPGGEDRRQRGPGPPQAHQHEPDQHREHQVELLLDGQRPVVLHRRRDGEEVGVRLAREVEAPVGHVGQRRHHVAPQRVLGRVQHGGRQHQDQRQAGHRRRHQAPQPSHPEAAEPDATCRGLLAPGAAT